MEGFSHNSNDEGKVSARGLGLGSGIGASFMRAFIFAIRSFRCPSSRTPVPQGCQCRGFVHVTKDVMQMQQQAKGRSGSKRRCFGFIADDRGGIYG